MSNLLYNDNIERDACGIGAVVNIDGHADVKALDDALSIVEKLEHRAGKDASGKVGDGVGILLQISHRFFSKAARCCGVELKDARDYGIGMFFFPQNELKRTFAKRMFEVICEKSGMKFLGWRDVPVRPEILGDMARDCQPYNKDIAHVMQGYIKQRSFQDKNGNTRYENQIYITKMI